MRQQTLDGTSFYGAEGHFFFGGGLTSVTCKDECGASQTFRFMKLCFGGALGAGVSGGVVMGMDGKQCRSDTYKGWFYEVGASIGPLSAGVDDGVDTGEHGVPGDNRTGVTEISLGVGLGASIKSTYCYYIPLQ
jgi:hypothetical protein